MAKKTTKKVDVKKVAKTELSAMLAEFLTDRGLAVRTDADSFGFTDGTLVVGMEATDVQVKFITPKAGLTRYEVIEDEDEVDNLEG